MAYKIVFSWPDSEQETAEGAHPGREAPSPLDGDAQQGDRDERREVQRDHRRG